MQIKIYPKRYLAVAVLLTIIFSSDLFINNEYLLGFIFIIISLLTFLLLYVYYYRFYSV